MYDKYAYYLLIYINLYIKIIHVQYNTVHTTVCALPHKA